MSRKTSYNRTHDLEFGLKVAERDPVSTEVVSACCQFCVFFGREEKVGAKRKPTSYTKYFRAPFRVKHFRKHLNGQHPSRWEAYQKLDRAQKLAYFTGDASISPINQTIRAYFGGSQAPMIEDIDGSIVDVLISDMMFDPDTEESTVDNALIAFELQKFENIFEEDSPLNDWYKVTLKNPL